MSGFAADQTAKTARPLTLKPITPAKTAVKQSAFLDSIESPKDQLELFLWKFKDIVREDIEDKLTEFLKFDHGKRGCLGMRKCSHIKILFFNPTFPMTYY
jgi:hypothetical protein